MTVDPKQCLATLDRRARVRQEAMDVRFAQAQADAQRIVAMIADKYCPNRIYQWGSLLDRNRFWERSDIDLAVEGLRGPEQFFGLWGEADAMTRLPLDLVELERIEPEFADLIRTRGVIAWQRTDPSP